MQTTRRLPRASLAPTWALAAALGLYAGAMVLASLAAPVGVFDESQRLLGGLLVGQGLVPHRDFWSPYPPLDHALLALVFRLLAPSALAARLLPAALYLAVLASLALHARSLSPGAPARAAALALAGALILGNAFECHWWDAQALVVLAVTLAIHARRAPARWTAGGLLALAALGKLNFAAYAGGALLLEAGVRAVRERSARPLSEALPLWLPPALAAGAWLAAQGPHAPDAIEQLLRVPARDVGPHRALELLPGAGRLATALAIALPLVWLALRCPPAARVDRALALAAAAAVALFVISSGSDPSGAVAAVPAVLAATLALQLRSGALARDELALLSAQALFCHYFLYRADDVHRATLLAWQALLLPAGAARLRGPARALALGLVAWLGLLAPGSALAPPDGSLRHAPAPERVATALRLLRAGALGEGDSAHLLRASLPLADGWRELYPDADELRAAQWLADRLEPGEPLYVGLGDHTRVFLGSLRSYWILGRRPGVRRFLLEPGLTTRDDVQQDMIADLERGRVRLALLWERPALEPGRSAPAAAGSPRLDAYLRRHYRPVVRYGAWVVFERESAEPSAAPGRRARRMK
jgi:hypothetical protein